MEDNIIKEYLGQSFYEFLLFVKYVWAIVAPYVYAYLTSTTMLLYKIAKRKPDESGAISEFSMKYLLKDRGFFIAATGIAVFIFTSVSIRYFPKTDAILIGLLIGAASSYLGKFLEFLGETVFNRGKKAITQNENQNG